MIVDGRSVTDIAQELSLSVKTVSSHKARMMHKLGVGNPSELFRYAMDHGLGNGAAAGAQRSDDS
jgi:DNA-binding NarL/FixJ family response regulator